MYYEIDFSLDGENSEVYIEASTFEEAEASFRLIFPTAVIYTISETENAPFVSVA